MRFDDLATAWKEQNAQPLSAADREAMIARVCRRVERLGGVVVRRDTRETIVAVLLILCFGGYALAAPADHVVSRTGAGLLVCWAVFIIYKMYRARTIQKPAPLDAPVREFCRIEVARLDRQIRLMRGVLWWYIAPCMIGVNIMFVGMAGLSAASLVYCIATLLLAWGIYALNMTAVAKELTPARNELAGLLNQLQDSSTVVEQSVQPPAKPRRFFWALVLLLTLAALGLAIAAFFVDEAREYPKRAPFSAVRWEGSKPLVKIGEEWFTLVSLDGIPAQDIVRFSRWKYVDKWRKRFEEDLVEVLTRMGHEPKDTVRLVVSPSGSQATRTLENVPMTEADRSTIYNARNRTDPSR